MTVEELIEKLEQFDPQTEIYRDGDIWGSQPVVDVQTESNYSSAIGEQIVVIK